MTATIFLDPVADNRAKVFAILVARYVEPKSHPNSK